MNVVQNSRWDANRQDRQLADRFMPGSPRHVDHDSLMQLDRLVVQDHRTPAVDDVVKLIRPFVVVKLRIVDLDVMNLGRGPIFFLDQWPDLSARFFPRFDLGWVTTQDLGCDVHAILLSEKVAVDRPWRPSPLRLVCPDYRITLEGRSERLRQTPEGSLNYHPQPSPDGRWLVYGSKRDGVRQLYVMRLEDMSEYRITPLQRGRAAMWPYWQPRPGK
jgi:hypothetical protein